MPDVHYGKGATVGSLIAMRDAVAPAAVGVDIGCGMSAVRTSLRAEDLPDDLAPLRRRGNLLHSSWVVQTDEDGAAVGEVTRRHMKTGDEHRVDQAELDHLGHRIGLHAATGYAYSAFAMVDLFARDGEAAGE
jgi:RNA-splicing ligase RtcB